MKPAVRSFCTALAPLAVFACLATTTAAAARRPNVLLIFADDLGYADLGVQGCRDTATPHIDSIAAAGVRFTDGYVTAPVCSPSRAGLITGRWQTRFGHEFNAPGADRAPVGMPKSERTMADYLHDAGYVTGHIGKWHLGNRDLGGYKPKDRGFVESVWYPGQKKLPPLTPVRGDERFKDDEYINDAMAREAGDFIRRHRGEPWFLYVALLVVHDPVDVPDDMLAEFSAVPDQKRRRMAAMISSMDDAVGQMLRALRESGVEDDTLVFFISDNGAPTSNGSLNTPLCGHKGSLFEGGIRIPYLLQWKGRIPPGQTFTNPVTTLDVLPTALAAAGVAARPEWKLDGVNLLPWLTGERAGPPHEMLFWRYGDQWAVRAGDWKLFSATDKKSEPPSIRLVNLATDPGESQDLSSSQPDRVKALRSAWDAWNRQNVPPLWTSNSPAPPKPKR